MKYTEVELNVSVYYLPALINSDYSGLYADEIERLDEIGKKYGYAVCPSFDIEAEKDFSRCDICRLLSDCVPVTFIKENP